MKNIKRASDNLHLNANHQFMVDFICAWCGKILGKMPSKNNRASHGICQQCLKRVAEEHQAGGKMNSEQQAAG